MTEPEDFDYNREALNRRVKSTKQYGMWKSLTPAQRRWFTVTAVIALIVIAAAVAAYWDVIPMPFTSGEGG